MAEPSTASPALDDRVLIVAPTRRDSEIARRALCDVLLQADVCPSLAAFCGEVRRGAAAALVTDDILAAWDLTILDEILTEQPDWSELPFIVLASTGVTTRAVTWLQTRTSVTLLERSVHIRTLVSAVQMAVRTRHRQYQVRDLIATERQARLDADRANQAKDRFLAVLSHELRTPLTPIVFASTALQRQVPTQSSLRPAVDMISRNAKLEAKLIDDLLDLSGVVQGKLQLQRVEVDLHEKLHDTIAMVDNDVRTKGVGLRVTLEARASRLFADPSRIQQVFWNILKNAIKFTPSGGTVVLSTRNIGDDFVVSCADTGIGIPEQVLSRIFEPFQQGSEEVTRLYGGLGLGLAVSRSLVEAHGGSLTARSDGPGCGAEFIVRLPNATDASAASRTGALDEDEERAALGLKILLVEDHPDTAQALYESLTARGHDVRLVHTVGDALHAAASDDYELLVSDIGLPDGSGLDLVRRMAPRPRMGAIALSGFGMDEDVRRSRSAGFNRHLTKPVDFRQLEHAIAELRQGM